MKIKPFSSIISSLATATTVIEGEEIAEHIKIRLRYSKQISLYLIEHLKSGNLSGILNAADLALFSNYILVPNVRLLNRLVTALALSNQVKAASIVKSLVDNLSRIQPLNELFNEAFDYRVVEDVSGVFYPLVSVIKAAEDQLVQFLNFDSVSFELFLRHIPCPSDRFWQINDSKSSPIEIEFESPPHTSPFTVSRQLTRHAERVSSPIKNFSQTKFLFDSAIYKDLPSDYQSLVDQCTAQSEKPFALMAARNSQIIVWQNVINTGYGNQNMVLYSSGAELYLSRLSPDEPDYMYSYTIFDQHTGGQTGDSLYSIKPNRRFFQLQKFDHPIYLLGGSTNFGHWFLDTFSLLAGILSLDFPDMEDAAQFSHSVDDIPILTNPLLSWQREALNVLSVQNPVIEQRTEPGVITIIECPEIYVSGGLSLPNRFECLRRAFKSAAAAMTTNNCAPRPEFVYLSRAGWDESHGSRVRNRTEVNSVMAHEGFYQIQPERFEFLELVLILSTAKVVAVDPGSTRFNCLLFAPDEAIHLVLTPKSDVSNSNGVERDFIWHIPFWKQTVFIHGDSAGLDNPLSASISYPVAAVSEGIAKAKMLAMSRH